MADTETRPARTLTLPDNELRQAPYARGHWFVTVPSEMTFEQVMTPSFWANVVRPLSGGETLRPFALVEVLRKDGTMDLLLRVIECKPGMVKMRCLTKYVSDENIGKPAKGAPKAGDDKLEFPAGYKGAYVPNSGWLVRLGNGEILVKGLADKATAVERAKLHAAEASEPAI